MKLCKLQNDGGKWKVTDPREGKGVTTCKSAEEAIALHDALNAEIVAAASEEAAASTVPSRIEILSKDGRPVLGVPTTRATDAVVMTKKDQKTITEMDLASITGYVIVSRDHRGRVAKAFTNEEATDFGRAIPVSIGALETLRSWFNQPQS